MTSKVYLIKNKLVYRPAYSTGQFTKFVFHFQVHVLRFIKKYILLKKKNNHKQIITKFTVIEFGMTQNGIILTL